MRGLRGASFVKSFPVIFLFILQISNKPRDSVAKHMNKIEETPLATDEHR
jgi:hypothetical protein